MAVSDVEAVCRSEAQRVLTHLRGNRKFGNLSRGWRELADGSPIKQISEWRFGPEASPRAFLDPLLRIVRSPEFAGPSTYVALEAAHAVVVSLCENPRTAPSASRALPPALGADEGASPATESAGVGAGSVASLAPLLREVCDAVCECVFEETDRQTDEATAMQMVALLGHCATHTAGTDATAFPASARFAAFSKVLSLWEHYRKSLAFRACAQSVLQRMLDAACADLLAHSGFLGLVLDRMLQEIEQEMPMERTCLYLRLLQRLTTHPSARRWCVQEGPQGRLFQDTVPTLLLRICDKFGSNITVLSLLLPVVNRICWLCVDHWVQADAVGANGTSSSLGALQVEALLSSVYLRNLSRAVVPLQAAEGAGATMSVEEAAEQLIVLFEGLADLLQPDTVHTIWLSFDTDWKRPALLEQIIVSIADLFRDAPSTERQLPAHVVHLSTTVLTRIVAAFDSLGTAPDEGDAKELERVRRQRRRREATVEFMALLEESPKKARAALDKSMLGEFLQVPAPPFDATEGNAEPEEWAQSLTWIFRCLNHLVPYPAMGEFFGQPKDESKHAFAAFVNTFDMGALDLDEAMRGFLQAFRLPGEAQQIDRVLETFGNIYYRKHVEHCLTAGTGGTGGYLRSGAAAYTLAFSIIMLNVDQHNPKLKRRMNLTEFIVNNRGINEGENIPEEVLTRIFNNIRRREILTPSSGSLSEGMTTARWEDLMHLVRRGYRDNGLVVLRSCPRGHVQGFLDRMGTRLRAALEPALASDPNAQTDALQGLEKMWHLTLRHHFSEADSLAEGLFFFGTEVFHHSQYGPVQHRASSCLRALFRNAAGSVANMGQRQLHMMVYLTVQFALYGLVDRALPPPGPNVARLLRTPMLLVDPPTGAVYNFLRKLSTAPFKMLNLAEDGGAVSEPGPLAGATFSAATAAPSGAGGGSASDPDSPRRAGSSPQDESELEVPPAPRPTPTSSPGSSPRAAGTQAAPPPAGAIQAKLMEAAPLSDDRPQIEQVFENCDFALFARELLGCCRPAPRAGLSSDCDASAGSSSEAFLAYLSAVFLSLRPPGAKVAKDQDLPWWPEPPAAPTAAPPQALQLPKRALSLNVMDGYETLRFALRLTALAFAGLTPTAGEAAADALEAVGGGAAGGERLWEPAAVQELAACSHVGLFHTLRRTDIAERTVRVGIIALFQVATALLTLKSKQGWIVSVGWPVRLVDLLVQRGQGEPQTLVPAARLCVEAARGFVAQVSHSRALDNVDLWRYLLLLLTKSMPTPARALWSGPQQREVEAVQSHVWRSGLVWLLGHPHLVDCVAGHDAQSDASAAAAASAPSAAAPGATGPVPSAGSGFWGWVLPEMNALALEVVGTGNRAASARLLLDAYGTLLQSIATAPTPEEYSLDLATSRAGSGSREPSPSRSVAASLPAAPPRPEEGPVRAASAPAAAAASEEASSEAQSDVVGADEDALRASSDGLAAAPFVAPVPAGGMETSRMPALSSAWSKVAISFLGYVGPSLARAQTDETDAQIVPLLKQTLLSSRVPMMLDGAELGPHWARLVLEKLVSSFTNSVNAGAPLVVVRDVVALVAKFFLQNLHTLQRHDKFGQLWLMVLRLMLLFVKRGIDDRDAELEEIATETLKNLLQVLLSMKVLGFTAKKGSGAAAAPTPPASGETPVWWQMTWDCIEVFLPGFGDEFSKSAAPKESAPEAEPAPPPDPPAPSAAAAAPPPPPPPPPMPAAEEQSRTSPPDEVAPSAA